MPAPSPRDQHVAVHHRTTVAAGVAFGTYRHELDRVHRHGAWCRPQYRRVGDDRPAEREHLGAELDHRLGVDVLSHLNGNAGTVNNILTSYANAPRGAGEVSVAGSINYFA